ncbi:hypothetical protein T05_994 [Trichinella murrelli]|uniref:Uncharacterized protein n=1 Tax=Trichinella murrelli TaxID=144512 RepID=A0A0V0TIV9_9BILA|nr:hypothetical protein T05_994 [Trichinella murrelli]
MCLMSSSKGIDIWLEIGERLRGFSTKYIPQMGFQSSYSTLKPLSTPEGRYRPFWLALL